MRRLNSAQVISHKSQVISHKLGLFKIAFLFFFVFTCDLRLKTYDLFAQEDTKLLNLSKQIGEAKYTSEFYGLFEELKNMYFSGHKYDEFVDFLKSLSTNKQEAIGYINYYIALSRYEQLRYLESKQEWEEYFAKGNDYRKELQESADKVIKLAQPSDAVKMRAQLVLWKFHKGEQGVLQEDSLLALMNCVAEYAKLSLEIKPIKYIADELSLAGEKSSARQIYGIYVNKLFASDVKQEDLLKIAADFYKEANLELSEGIYDAYIDKVLLVYPKQKALPILIDIARQFSYKPGALSDALYAEKIFDKISGLGGKEAFDEGLYYLRAFNLEIAKDFLKAKDIYSSLIQDYPKGVYADKVNYKLGIFSAYMSADLKSARDYFTVLAQWQDLTPQVICALYQLGLHAQWEGDLDSAKGYYAKLFEKAKDGFQDTVNLTKERLKEIEEKKPIEYNLKTFLDVSLKNKDHNFDATRLGLKASLYLLPSPQEVGITSDVISPQSGCMPVELRYLWSGHLGEIKPANNETSFNSKQAYKGIKDINLVVVSPSGVFDRNFEMIDID